MDALVAEVTVACIPDPMPVVMKTVARERFQRRWPGPKVIVDSGRNWLGHCVADRVAPFEAQPACEIDFADHASIVQSLDRFLNGGRRANLRAVLNDATVLLG